MQKKRFLSLFLLLIFTFTLILPIDTYAVDSYHPVFEKGTGAIVKSFNDAAVVGKVIEWNESKQKYVVYGRLSANAGTGYKVYYSGMFFLAEPVNNTVKKELENYISQGKGVKLFGRYASSYDAEATMFFSRVEEYKPELDYTVGLKPAYSNTEPSSWIGFGIHRHVNNSLLTDLNKTSDWVNSLYPFTQSLKQDSREIVNIDGKDALKDKEKIYYPEDFKTVFKNDIYRDETPEIVPKLASSRTESHRLYLNEIKSKIPLQNVFFLIQDNTVNNQSINALGGTVFVKALQGQSNYYLQSIPVTRPDIDRFLKKLEQQELSNFSEWADSGLFYGSVKPIYNTIKVNGKIEKVYSHAEFTGSYFPDSKTSDFIETIEGYSREIAKGIPYNYPVTDEEDKFRNKENWTIEGMDEKTALRLASAGYTWLTGTRYLVYRIPCNCESEDCPGYYDVTIDSGNMKDDPKATLIARYMTYDKAITKPELNFGLSVLREFAF